MSFLQYQQNNNQFSALVVGKIIIRWARGNCSSALINMPQMIALKSTSNGILVLNILRLWIIEVIGEAEFCDIDNF